MQPTVGRIVHYKDCEGKTFAALVVGVFDGVVNLAFWSEFGRQSTALNVKQGDEPGQWQWPSRT